MKKLYILQTEQNILNVIAAKYFDFKHVVILKDTSFQSPFAENSLVKYLQREGFKIDSRPLNPYDSEQIKHLSDAVNKDDLFIIPNSRSAYTLNMVNLLQNHCQLAFVEEDGDIYIQKDKRFEEIKMDHVHLNVEDYINNFGGIIEKSSNEIFDEPCANALLNIILKDLNTYRSMLKGHPCKTNEHTGYVQVKMSSLSLAQKTLMTKLIDTMIRYNICGLKDKSNHRTIIFYDADYKPFIATSGNWLEMATYKALKSIHTVDSTMSSVHFFWNRRNHNVSNEIDVMGTCDNRLILISCKDTGNNLEKALYEVYTHGEQLGFDESIKILVTTAHLYDQLKQRAKELGIHLIRFEKDTRSLSVGLKSALKKRIQL